MSSLSSRRPAPRFFWLWAAVWLFYMANPLGAAWNRPELWQRAVGIIAVLLFCALYLRSFVAARTSLRRTGTPIPLASALVRLALMALLTGALCAAVGEPGLTALVYIG